MTSRRTQQLYVQGGKYPSKVDIYTPDEFDVEEHMTNLLRFENEDVLEHPYLGFSVLTDSTEGKSEISYLAFATFERAVVIKRPPKGFAKQGHDVNWEAIKNALLASSQFSYTSTSPSKGNGDICSKELTLVSFNLLEHALTLHRVSKGQLGVRGIDLSVLLPEKPGVLPTTIIQQILEGSLVDRNYELLWRKPKREGLEETQADRVEVDMVAWRAWMAVLAAEARVPIISKAPELKTSDISKEDLDLLSDVQHQFDLLEASKPESTENDFSEVVPKGTGEYEIVNSAFKNKNRMGSAQTVYLKTRDGTMHEARITKTRGKRAVARVATSKEIDGKDVISVETVGVDDPTSADVSRTSYMLAILQGKDSLHSSPFIRKIWRPTESDKEELRAVKSEQDKEIEEDCEEMTTSNLNASQAKVSRAMLSDSNFALVHGPPGTGKTRTIAYVANEWVKNGLQTYLVAQSNVGVKNIAESLAKNGDLDFKLLVSSEFYEDWHENIYPKCKPHMIRSDEFREGLIELIGNAKLILSTVNMLFNKTLDKKHLFDLVPMERLVVDEASQIFIGDYIALFHKFHHTLKKVCWFGDPRQLPPHQGEQILGLSSVYDIPHLKENSLLLDTQFRMPAKIGDFISKTMYEGKLKSSHEVQDHDCLKFVDVGTGFEDNKGTSWINRKEALTVADLVEKYYTGFEFCVITPYDSQRKLIEDELKKKGLSWKGRCYNVDSFQGNEAPYIIISAVRTKKTGFLDLMNRVNVMLTRCQKAMIIVTNKRFLKVEARMTMVGQLASSWVKAVGEEKAWADYVEVQKKYADMPGVLGDPAPRLPTPPPIAPVSSPGGFFAFKPTTAVAPPTWGGSKPTPMLLQSAAKSFPPGLKPSSPTATKPVFAPKIASAWSPRLSPVSAPPQRAMGSSSSSSSPNGGPNKTSASSGSKPKKIVLNGGGSSAGRPAAVTKNAWGNKS